MLCITFLHDTRLLPYYTESVAYLKLINKCEEDKEKANSHTVLELFSSFRLGVKAGVVMIPLLGVTWLFGFLSPLHKVFTYIFTILNSIQVSANFVMYEIEIIRLERTDLQIPQLS